MIDNNILITCVGRQVFLVNEFKKALNGAGSVYAVDIDKDSAGLKEADFGYTSMSFSNPEYITWLTDIIRKNNIKLLLTLNVDELLVLERNRIVFDEVGCILVGGEYEKIQLSMDKLRLSQELSNYGIPTLNSISLGKVALKELSFPIIIKPRFGKGSRGIFFAENELELREVTLKLSEENIDYIVQDKIAAKEYGLDIVNDFNGDFLTVHIREKVKMLNGETNIAVTRKSDAKWEVIAKDVSSFFKHQGTMDVDVLVDQFDNRYVIDINHRFGGGYVFSHMAGANTPKLYVSLAFSLPLSDSWLKSQAGVKSSRDVQGGVDIEN